MEAFLNRILSRFGYRIVNNSGKRNVKDNLENLILALIYMVASIYNAYSSSEGFVLFDEFKHLIPTAFPTISLIIINFILLRRLHIKLKLNFFDEIEDMSNWLNDGCRYDDIIDHGINFRINVIEFGYLVDVVILLFIYRCGNSTIDAIATVAVISVVITFLDDVIETIFSVYTVKTKMSLVKYIEK